MLVAAAALSALALVASVVASVNAVTPISLNYVPSFEEIKHAKPGYKDGPSIQSILELPTGFAAMMVQAQTKQKNPHV